MHKKAAIEFHPLGVIGIISPWNFPFQNIRARTIPALFAGNAVLLQGLQTVQAPKSSRGMFDAVLQPLRPLAGSVQILTGYGETGAALTRFRRR